jgi:hypothetical protein
MRLVVDAGFPQYVENFRIADLELVRWHAQPFTDLDLVRALDNEGFSGVIFLGSNVAEARDFVSQVSGLRPKVFLTYNTDPHDASMDIEHQMEEIRRAVPLPGIHMIYSRDVRPWNS